MNFKTFVFTSIASLTLTACALTPKNEHNVVDQAPANPILQTIQNIDTVPESSLGNQAVLIKEAHDFCQIEFTGFYQMGKVTENWAFKGDQLLYATTTKTLYKKDSDPIDSSYENKNIASVTLVAFDIKTPEKIQNFIKLKSYFKKSELEQCHK